MSDSNKKAVVIPLILSSHGNADSLSVVDVDGLTVVVNTAMWQGHTTAVYIPAETIVPTTRTEFSFLDRGRGEEVVMARRLRGVWSVGLLVPTPVGFNIDDDCWEYFGLKHYEPNEEEESNNGWPAPPHWGSLTKYDLSNYRKYKYLLQDKEVITITEKLNGENMSCVYSEGAFHVKSRNLWKNELDGGNFWEALNKNEPLKRWLRDNENFLVQGELIGRVKNFQYGLNGEVEFRAFDIRQPNYQYMNPSDYLDVCEKHHIITPRIFSHETAYSDELVLSFVDGDQQGNPKGIREGVVIKPNLERFVSRLNGRLALKCVSNSYLEKVSK